MTAADPSPSDRDRLGEKGGDLPAEARGDLPAEDGGDRPAEERIIRATMLALAELDPSAVTIKQICRAAQVTPPTIYYHFGNKDGLLAAAVERLVAQWLAAMDAALDRQAPLPDALAQATAVWTAAITSPSRPLAVFTWATLLLAESSEPTRRALIGARDQGLAMVRDVATLHVGGGPHVDLIAELIIDTVIASAVHYELDRDREALQARLDGLGMAVRAIAQSFGPQSSPA